MPFEQQRLELLTLAKYKCPDDKPVITEALSRLKKVMEGAISEDQ